MKALNQYLFLAAVAPFSFTVPALGLIHVSAELNHFENSYVYSPELVDPFDPWMSFPATATYQQSYSAQTVPGLVYEFSEAGEVSMEVTWSAPAGQQFVLYRPDVALWNYSVSVEWQRSGTHSTMFFGTGMSAELNDASEPVTTSAPSIWLRDNADSTVQIYTNIDIPVGETTITFSSITLRGTVPAEYNQNLNFAALDLFRIQVEAYGADLPETQPSYNLLSLQPIPEPSTYAALLGALALGIVAMRRGRRG